MAIPLRRILRILYPTRLSGGRPGNRRARFLTKRFVLGLLLVFVLLKVVLGLYYYNMLLSLGYDVEEATAQVDTQLQRRRNIILNLGLMVSDYAKHEKEIFKHTTETRREMVEPESGTAPRRAQPSDQGRERPVPEAPENLDALLSKPHITASDLDALLSRIFAIAERYPDLRLSENFQHFMDALVDAEDKIAEQRMVYNERANMMSTEVGKFPGFLFARLFGFEPPPFFEPEAEARTPLKVEPLAP